MRPTRPCRELPAENQNKVLLFKFSARYNFFVRVNYT
jgi:hypothetical protein